MIVLLSEDESDSFPSICFQFVTPKVQRMHGLKDSQKKKTNEKAGHGN